MPPPVLAATNETRFDELVAVLNDFQLLTHRFGRRRAAQRVLNSQRGSMRRSAMQEWREARVDTQIRLALKKVPHRLSR